MIEARGLTKRYGPTLVVDDLSFTIRPGRVTGFVGPNGAGKTTTMRLMLGLDYPTRGTVTVRWRVRRILRGRGVHWAQVSPQDRAAFDPAQSAVIGLALLGQLVIVVLGALTITSEYSTGMIRTSLTVMPRSPSPDARTNTPPRRSQCQARAPPAQ
jgi:ABC-type cobalamin/Fe3+-siderophores transport system ATPase subunit